MTFRLDRRLQIWPTQKFWRGALFATIAEKNQRWNSIRGHFVAETFNGPLDPTSPLCVAGSLQIRQSLESDEGRYECLAENSVGIAYSHAADLYVRGRSHSETSLSPFVLVVTSVCLIASVIVKASALK